MARETIDRQTLQLALIMAHRDGFSELFHCVVKLMQIEFSRVIAADECAVAIQRILAQLNDQMPRA